MRHRMLIAAVAVLLVFPSGMMAGGPDWFTALISRLDSTGAAATALRRLPPGAGRAQRMSAIAAALRRAESPRPLWVIPEPAIRDPHAVSREARDAVLHHIHSQYGSEQFGDTLPWFSPTKRVQTVARFPHFDWLAPAVLGRRETAPPVRARPLPIQTGRFAAGNGGMDEKRTGILVRPDLPARQWPPSDRLSLLVPR